MPSGLKRFQKAEALHFIPFSCFHRLPLLEAPGTCEIFETVLERVKRGLVARPEDWAWSSFCHYATGIRGVVEIESE